MKPIPGYEHYLIDETGNVYVRKSMKLRKPYLSPRGYLTMKLITGKKHTAAFVHRLVAYAYMVKPEGKTQINHMDGDRLNNSVDNLEWCTSSENLRHAVNLNLIKSGSLSHRAKLSKEQVWKILDHKKGPIRSIETAKMFGISKPSVLHIWHGRTYKREVAEYEEKNR